MENTFTAIFEKVDDWYIGYAQELPGANVQEKTLEEARESLREAIELILISNRELAEQQLSSKDVVREKMTVAAKCPCELSTETHLLRSCSF